MEYYDNIYNEIYQKKLNLRLSDLCIYDFANF